MPILTRPVTRDCTNSLGIPVDNLSLQQAVDRIVMMALNRDGNARLVSTLNVDFLVNALGWALSRPRHPELLEVLRNSDMVTADGFPIVWLSRLMGKPLKDRVTGADIVPALATRAAQDGLSLYLLGGKEGSAASAAQALTEANPELLIAGTSAPFIHTSGPQLMDFSEDDEATITKINFSGADILLVGLGNPKQELWFNRNRHKLKIPVSIGVGGTFDFVNGEVSRAPEWVQQLNLEWVYRIKQDPARLWRRYARGLITLGILTAPLMYYRAKEVLFHRSGAKEAVPKLRWQSVWSSRNQSLSVLSLPRRVRAKYLQALLKSLIENQDNGGQHLLDFSDVRHIDNNAQQEFFSIGALLRSAQSNVSLLGLSPSVKRHLAACRIIDVIGEGFSGNTLSALAQAPENLGIHETGCSSYAMNRTTLIFLSGRASGESLDGLGLFECIAHAARDRTCILDLRNIALLESAAIARLQAAVVDVYERGEGAILISGAGPNIRQMFRVTGLERSAIFIDDSTLLASISAESEMHG